jgi:hypothetical protein
VGPRRYLGQDETLDYEVMSDLEWEEEPEDGGLKGTEKGLGWVWGVGEGFTTR